MMKRLMAVLAAVAVLSGCSAPPPTDACKGRVEGDLVITEVMIDPDGTDTGGEWIELFNTLGTPLDLKGLTLYVRDTDGSGAKTHLIRAGTAPARGYFVAGDIRSGPNPAWINYSYADGLGSMGNARGVVGVRCGTTVLAELTYTTAAKANRSRMLNGTNEPSSALAKVEANYCDTPTGNIYAGNNAGTPGQANPVCQAEATTGTCVENGAVRPMTAPQAGDLIITEVMANPAAASETTGEWFELLARASVDLNDISVSTSTDTTRITAQDCLRVNPGEYVLLAKSADSFVNGDLPPPRVIFSGLSFNDTMNQRVWLSRGDAGIDEIALTGASSGRSWQLDPLKLDPASNDNENNFCKAATRWNPDGGGDFGSPGAENPPCPIDAGVADPSVCTDLGTGQQRAVRPPADGDLVISEWLSAPAATTASNGEWVEVFVKSDVDLNGLVLQVGTGKTTVSSATCLPATANSYLVFGKNGNPTLNGGLPPLTASFTAALTGTSTISVLGSDGGVYDTVTASGERSGKAVQVAPGFLTPADNDQVGNRCDAPSRWSPDGGGDFGSPGLANPACAGTDGGVTPSGQCFDTAQMALRPIVGPMMGELVITEWLSDPGASVSDGDGEFFELMAKGTFDLNGLVLRVGTTSTAINSGNCLSVTPNSYLVFGKNGDSTVNGGLPALAGTFGGSLTGTSTITVLTATSVTLDSITATGETAAASVQVRAGFETPADNDVAGNRCTTPPGAFYPNRTSGIRGSPGAASTCP
jgi:hypothetical protein